MTLGWIFTSNSQLELQFLHLLSKSNNTCFLRSLWRQKENVRKAEPRACPYHVFYEKGLCRQELQRLFAEQGECWGVRGRKNSCCHKTSCHVAWLICLSLPKGDFCSGVQRDESLDTEMSAHPASITGIFLNVFNTIQKKKEQPASWRPFNTK